MNFILRMLVEAAAIFGLAYLSEGTLLQRMDFWPTAVLAAVALALVNALIKPIVKFLALPVTMLTLGLFGLVINAAMLYIVDWVVPGFDTVGVLQTIIAAVILAIVGAVAGKLLDKD